MKKKIVSLLLILCMLCSVSPVFPFVASAAINGTCGDNLTWSLDDNGTLTISGTGDMYDYGWYNPAPWNSQCNSIKQIIVENGTTSIGSAFSELPNVQNITLPETLARIPSNAFYNCSNLSIINIPDNVKIIEEYAFRDCTNLACINLHDNLQKIDVSAFSNTAIYNNSSNWVDGVLYIGNYLIKSNNSISNTYSIRQNTKMIVEDAFSDCPNLSNIIIPDSVTYIGRDAFFGTALYNNQDNWIDGVLYINNHLIKSDKSVSGNYSVKVGTKTIATGAFDDCFNLTNITLPDSIIGIGAAFYSCKNLNSINIPNGIKTIEEFTFSDCQSLKQIILPDSVETIENQIIEQCSSLTDFHVGSGVKSIHPQAFVRCNSLSNISVSPDNAYYTSVAGNLFSKDKTKLIRYAVGKEETNYIVPQGVTSIEPAAFRFANNLLSVCVANDVVKVGRQAFNGCDGLEEITFGEKVTSIGEAAVSHCYNLGVVNLPASLVNIENSAFYNCKNITDVYYNGTREQWNTVNIDSGNENLVNANIHFINDETTTIHPTRITLDKESINLNVDETAILTANVLPQNAANKNIVWQSSNADAVAVSQDGTIRAISLGQATITATTVDGQHSATCKIYVVGNGVCGNNATWEYCNYTLTIKGTGDMYDYDGLSNWAPWISAPITKIHISAGITSIGNWAFACLDMLQNIKIAGTVTKIGKSAFAYCTNTWFSHIYIPYGVKSIGENAFLKCDWLYSIEIPTSVKEIGNNAFEYCYSLNKVYIDDTISWCNIEFENEKSNPLYYADKLLINNQVKTNIIVPDGITGLSSYTFRDFSSLATISIPTSITNIKDMTFMHCYDLTDVYYQGTKAEWEMINIGTYGNNYLTNATIHFKEEPTTTIPVTSVSMLNTAYTVKIGQWKRLSVNCYPSNATNRNLKWSSSNPRIATVNDAGIVTGKSEGMVTMTAKSSNGKSASCTVTVVTRMDYNYEYLFLNHPREFGYNYDEDEKGNITKINYQIPKERYLQLGYSEVKAEQSLKTWGGSCFGMSASSIMFYKSILNESNYHVQELYDSIPSSPMQLLFPNKNTKLREMIELLQISQKLKCANAKPFDTNKVVQELANDKPVVLGMYEKGRKNGHAIVLRGYSVSNGLYELDFYDCGAYVKSLKCNNSKITLDKLDKTEDAPDWEIFEYYSFDDLLNIYSYIRTNGKNSISLFSTNNTETYTQIITPSNTLTISDKQGKTLDIQDGEICTNINDAKVIPSSYLTEEQTYTIILPTDTYTIVGNSDEIVTTSFADDYMSATVTAKSNTPITISSDLKEISLDTVANEEYNITYTTYDNVFDEMNLSGTTTGTITTKLSNADVLITGANTLTASASVSDSVVSANSDSLSNGDNIAVKCEETDSGATIQLLSGDTELTNKVSLPERLTVIAPAYDLASGTYPSGQILNFTKDDDTIIYYTTDGSVPSADNGIIYSLPIDINKSMTVKAISTKYGYWDSDVVELNYVLPEVDTPQATLEAGEYDKVVTVELSTVNYDDMIYYTLDGSNPLENGILYTVPINISEDAYLQAYTLRNGCISEISEYEYKVNPSYPLYFSNSLTNQNGKIITPDNIADVTKIKLMLSKLHAGNHTGTFLIAFYDSDGKLIFVNSKTATISDDMQEIEINVTENVSSAYRIKAFAWENLSDMKPICDVLEENIVE